MEDTGALDELLLFGNFWAANCFPSRRFLEII